MSRGEPFLGGSSEQSSEQLRQAALAVAENGLKEIDQIIANFHTYQNLVVEKIEDFVSTTPNMMEQLRGTLFKNAKEFSKLDEVAEDAQAAASALLARIEDAKGDPHHPYDEGKLDEVKEKLKELAENLRAAIAIVKRNLLSDLRGHKASSN